MKKRELPNNFDGCKGINSADAPEFSVTPDDTPDFEAQLYGAPISAMGKLIRATPKKDIYTGEITAKSGSVKFFFGTREITEAQISTFASKLIRILSQELAKVNTYREEIKKIINDRKNKKVWTLSVLPFRRTAMLLLVLICILS